LTLQFRARSDINLEVTLLRAAGELNGDIRIGGVISNKLGQMISECANVLILAADGAELSVADLAQQVKALKLGVERRDPAVCLRSGYSTPADFFREFQWLSAVALWDLNPRPGPRFALWQNPQARRVLPSDFASLALT
jgi:hypothetical protein